MPGLAGPDSAGTAAGTAGPAAHSSQRAGAASGPAAPMAGQAGQLPEACGTQAAWTAAARHATHQLCHMKELTSIISWTL